MGCGGSKTDARTPRGQPRRNTQKGGGQGAPRPPKKARVPVNEKGYKKRIRQNLRDASNGNDIAELEKCMEVFVNNHMEDGGDYSEAERRLEFLNMRKEIRDAIMRRHPQVLDKAIQKVEASPYKRQLKPYLDRAYYLKQHQNELDTFRHDISDMEQSTISEIRSYHHPPPGVHETMICTYMLLGYPEDHLIDWTEITALMGRYGKDSLIREVEMADMSKIDNNTAIRARSYLGQYSLEQVRSVSNGAAAFYVWSSRMVGKYDGKPSRGQDATPKKLINTKGKGQQRGSKGETIPKTPTNTTKPTADQGQNKKKAKQQENKVKQQQQQQQQQQKQQQQQLQQQRQQQRQKQQQPPQQQQKAKDTNNSATKNAKNIDKNAKTATAGKTTQKG